MSPKERHAHSVVQDKERHSILMACIIALIAVHILLNSASIRTPLIAQLIFGVLVGFVAFGVVAGVLDRRLPRVSVALVVFSGLMVLQVLQYPISPDAAGSKVLSDMAIMLLPLGITVVLMQWLRSSHRLLRLWLLVILVALVAALLAWLRAPTTDRFEAPSIVAIVGAWVFATVPITSGLSVRVRHWIRYSAGVAVVLLLPPVIGSGSRTAVIVWVLSGILCLILPGLKRMPRLPALLSLAAVTAVLGALFVDRVTEFSLTHQVLQQARLEDLLSGSVDASAATRVSEISDVIRTMHIEGEGLDYLLGFGHGATYSPQSSFIVPNVDLVSGRVHHIHATPFMLWFRYGLIGLLSFAAVMTVVVWRSVRNFVRARDSMSTFLLIAIVMYSVDLMVRNTFVDPGLALVIGSTLWLSQPREVGS